MLVKIKVPKDAAKKIQLTLTDQPGPLGAGPHRRSVLHTRNSGARSGATATSSRAVLSPSLEFAGLLKFFPILAKKSDAHAHVCGAMCFPCGSALPAASSPVGPSR